MLFFIHTLGCQMNYSDSERIEAYLGKLGFKKAKDETQADLIIFNSCSVRQKAEDRVLGSMQKLQMAKRKKKNLLIALTGCMVRKSSTKASKLEDQDKYIKKIDALDIAFRIEDLPHLRAFIFAAQKHNKIKSTPLPTLPEEELKNYFHISPKHTSKAQVFIPISTGCDKFCTYCIVPFARGREVSRPMEEILKEAEKAVKNGAKEITLLGQTVDSYGLSNIDRQKKLFDYDKIDAQLIPPPFVQLLKKIDKLKSQGLVRLRFTSPHPKDVSPELINSYKTLKTLMPHIHLPLQSGDNQCLKRMNRPYTVERYKEIVKALRKARPDIAITTDLIVGFCDESEKEFKNSYKLYKELEFDFCFLAQYSTRTGTYASKHLKDNVQTKEKSRRWHTINDEVLIPITQKKLEASIGKNRDVLVEKLEKKNGKSNTKSKQLYVYQGKDPYNKVVQFESGRKDLLGSIQKVKIKKGESWILFGEIV